MKKNNGGPAFPNGPLQLSASEALLHKQPELVKELSRINQYHNGISKRDYFAAAALQGMLAANAQNHPEVNDRNVDQVIAREAFASADAMIAESEKE